MLPATEAVNRRPAIPTIPMYVAQATLEAIGDGDSRYAADLLTNAIEVDGDYIIRSRCRVCGAGFPWAGLRDHHELMSHDPDPDGLAVAGTDPEPDPEHDRNDGDLLHEDEEVRRAA